MRDEDRIKLSRLRQEQMVQKEMSSVLEILNQTIPANSFSLQYNTSILEPFPTDRWNRELILQTPIENPHPIQAVLVRFLSMSPEDNCVVILPNYSRVMIKLSKSTMPVIWKQLIELDGDGIFCFPPFFKEFISIDKVEDQFLKEPGSGRIWLYELTFSNIKLRDLLNT